MKRMTKTAKRARAKTLSAKRRVAVALAKFLKQANPAMKTAGAKVQKLKGGVIKITPIKANGGGGRVGSQKRLASSVCIPKIGCHEWRGGCGKRIVRRLSGCGKVVKVKG